jgi:hypothetical protein
VGGIANRAASWRPWTVLWAWSLAALALNLLWEVVQLPLYTIASNEPAQRVVFAVVHCTGGDLVIAVATYVGAAFAVGRLDWPLTRPWMGGVLATALGLAYVVYSEWYNVYQAGNWTYTSAMPTVFGIGLTPLLQWVVIPAATLLVVRKSAPARRVPRSVAP